MYRFQVACHHCISHTAAWGQLSAAADSDPDLQGLTELLPRLLPLRFQEVVERSALGQSLFWIQPHQGLRGLLTGT